VPETGDSDVDTHIQSESGPFNLDAHPTLVAVDAISEIITQASVFDSPAGRIGDGTALLPETRGSATTVSEPTTPALLAIALAGIVFVRRRSRFPLEPE